MFSSIDAMATSLATLNVSEYVPVPWTTLYRQEELIISSEHLIQLTVTDVQLKEQLATVPDVLPLAQSTLQRVSISCLNRFISFIRAFI